MLEEQRTQSGADPVLSETGAPDAAPESVVPESEPVAPRSRWPSPATSPPSPPGLSSPAPPPPSATTVIPSTKPRRDTRYTDPVTWAIALTVFGAYAAISLFRLLQLNPTSWDLGIYTEYVKQVAHFQPPIADIRQAGFNLLGDHFQPIVALLAPFFRVFPSAATLLVAQASLAALSVFPVSRIAREKLGTGPGRAVALAYGFSWGLQQLVQFDFHEIAFAVPLLAFSLSALMQGRIKAAAWWAVPLVFVKEDQGFTVAAIGLYLIVVGLRAKVTEPAIAGSAQFSWLDDSERLEHFRRVGDLAELASAGRREALEDLADFEVTDGPAGTKCPDDPEYPAATERQEAGSARRDPGGSGTDQDPSGRRRIRIGQALLIWGFGCSFLAIGVIIPHFNPAHVYSYWSDGGVLAPGAHLSVTGLVAQLFHAWPDKLQTIVMLLLPTAFIALRSPVALLAVPSLLLRFMSTDSSYWGTFWHYNATVMPIIFLAAVDGLVRIRASMDADGAAGFASWTSGQRGPGRALLAGAQRYGAAMMIAIAVTLAFQFPLSNLWNAQTYRITPHVVAADAAMAKVPDGATVQVTLDLLASLGARTDTFWIGNSGNPRTEYIVFDGTDSNYSPTITNVPAFINQLYPHHLYTQIFKSGDVYVFRRTR
jgi:uncharacterized membrane protein